MIARPSGLRPALEETARGGAGAVPYREHGLGAGQFAHIELQIVDTAGSAAVRCPGADPGECGDLVVCGPVRSRSG